MLILYLIFTIYSHLSVFGTKLIIFLVCFRPSSAMKKVTFNLPDESELPSRKVFDRLQ